MKYIHGYHYNQSDRTYNFTTTLPPVSYFLKAAASIEKGSSNPGYESSKTYTLFIVLHLGHDIVGRISLKHVYEIALIKSQDPVFARVPLESICKTIVGTAKSIGIDVIRKHK